MQLLVDQDSSGKKIKKSSKDKSNRWQERGRVES
jgi:hypothetical protein